jgi:hypothetical protein
MLSNVCTFFSEVLVFCVSVTWCHGSESAANCCCFDAVAFIEKLIQSQD